MGTQLFTSCMEVCFFWVAVLMHLPAAIQDEIGYWFLPSFFCPFFQHVVFFIARMIDMMVPDIPEVVEIKVKREHYLAKQALAENKVNSELIHITFLHCILKNLKHLTAST